MTLSGPTGTGIEVIHDATHRRSTGGARPKTHRRAMLTAQDDRCINSRRVNNQSVAIVGNTIRLRKDQADHHIESCFRIL